MSLFINNKTESNIIIESATPTFSYDALNPNVKRIRIETKIPANTFYTNCIIISDNNDIITNNIPLAEWK